MHRPDLTGLQPVYRVHLGRAVRWVVVGCLVVIGLATAHRLLNRPDGWDIAFSVAQVVVFTALLVQQMRLPDAVFVLEDGLAGSTRSTVGQWSRGRTSARFARGGGARVPPSSATVAHSRSSRCPPTTCDS